MFVFVERELYEFVCFGGWVFLFFCIYIYMCLNHLHSYICNNLKLKNTYDSNIASQTAVSSKSWISMDEMDAYVSLLPWFSASFVPRISYAVTMLASAHVRRGFSGIGTWQL